MLLVVFGPFFARLFAFTFSGSLDGLIAGKEVDSEGFLHGE